VVVTPGAFGGGLAVAQDPEILHGQIPWDR
jgi:hypothetical protein